MWRYAILREIPGFVGCDIRNRFMPYEHGTGVKIWEHVQIDFPERLRMGDFVSINRYSIIHAGGGIAIGNHVIVGPRVTLYSQNHRFLVRRRRADVRAGLHIQSCEHWKQRLARRKRCSASRRDCSR